MFVTTHIWNITDGFTCLTYQTQNTPEEDVNTKNIEDSVRNFFPPIFFTFAAKSSFRTGFNSFLHAVPLFTIIFEFLS